jgi:3-phenylpropionate/cinnamic acid dioxygenase small subunit
MDWRRRAVAVDDTGDRTALRRLLLKEEIADFLTHEAELLDSRRYEDWLGLLTEDIRYWMPITRTVAPGARGGEFTAAGVDANWFDEGIETLRQRVTQLATGIHWAEQPPSRTTHMVSNLRIAAVTPDADDPREVAARCRFLVYRNRLDDEQDFYVGKRNDTLRRVDGAWKLARREIFLDQSVMLPKNVSVFL